MSRRRSTPATARKRLSAEGRREVIEFTYPERSVRLYPIDCRWLSGEPHPTGCEEPRWVAPSELSGYEFPPAGARVELTIEPEKK